MSETKQGICWKCGEPLIMPTSYGYLPACVNVYCGKANKEADDLLLKKARDILMNHNKWRRGDKSIEMINPTVLGEAIDTVLNELDRYEKHKK